MTIDLSFLKGYRSYIMLAADTVDQLGVLQGWWMESPLRYIVEFVLTGAAFRAGMK